LYDPTVAEILVAGTTADTGESSYAVVALTHYCFKALAVPVPKNANFSSTLLVRRLTQKYRTNNQIIA
jgi:hypothetical protein